MENIVFHEAIKINDVLIADTFMSRFFGYMFQKEPRHQAILIKPCNSIHTFFMKFDIDVLFLDENMKVVKKLEALKPGKIIMPVKGAAMVLEGKAGLLEKFNIGDNIDIEA